MHRKPFLVGKADLHTPLLPWCSVSVKSKLNIASSQRKTAIPWPGWASSAGALPCLSSLAICWARVWALPAQGCCWGSWLPSVLLSAAPVLCSSQLPAGLPGPGCWGQWESPSRSFCLCSPWSQWHRDGVWHPGNPHSSTDLCASQFSALPLHPPSRAYLCPSSLQLLHGRKSSLWGPVIAVSFLLSLAPRLSSAVPWLWSKLSLSHARHRDGCKASFPAGHCQAQSICWTSTGRWGWLGPAKHEKPGLGRKRLKNSTNWLSASSQAMLTAH